MSEEENWEHVPIEQKRLIGDDAITQYVHDAREGFVEYVISEARTPIYAESFDRESLLDALHALSREGFKTGEAEDVQPVCFAHPKRYKQFVNRLEEHTVVKITDARNVRYTGAEIKPDSSIPEDRVVCVHPEAVAPNVPHASSFKPWIVVYGKGIAVIEIHE